MHIYNTLTRKTEEFIPYENGVVKMYTCGPTVYNYAHIGNLRSYIIEDILEKSLNYLGYKVIRAMNITDVGHLTSDSDTGEDKMVKTARKEHKAVLDIAKYYTEKFFLDFESLNIKKPDIVIPATSEINTYIEIIKKLIDKGYAYLSDGNVYFDTSKLNNYYALTNYNEDELLVGVRENVTEDLNKKNKADFVLWFTKSKFEDQDLKWDSPWGYGYPGWHIECSGISLKYLGEHLDIHCGGVDNIFPHHTNEIAQSEAYLGHKWCNYWFHIEHLNDKNGKMSKSKGNILTVNVLKEMGYNPLCYRYFVISSHYQKPLEFSFENLDIANNAYMKLKNRISKLNLNDTNLNIIEFNNYNDKFKANIGNNLNTSLALTTLYDVLKSDMNDYTKYKLVESFDQVLSLDLLKNNEKEELLDQEILDYIEKRNIAKANKDYVEADRIRNILLEKKIKLNDTREGTTHEIIK